MKTITIIIANKHVYEDAHPLGLARLTPDLAFTFYS